MCWCVGGGSGGQHYSGGTLGSGASSHGQRLGKPHSRPGAARDGPLSEAVRCVRIDMDMDSGAFLSLHSAPKTNLTYCQTVPILIDR